MGEGPAVAPSIQLNASRQVGVLLPVEEAFRPAFTGVGEAFCPRRLHGTNDSIGVSLSLKMFVLSRCLLVQNMGLLFTPDSKITGLGLAPGPNHGTEAYP